MTDVLTSPTAVLDNAVARWNPSAIFVLFSGGHDSLTSAHLTMRHFGDRATVAHINTGIGIEQTRDFVRETCRREGWRLLEYKAQENRRGDGTPDPQVYEDIVAKNGFPGPPQHGLMYVRLKDRPLRCLIRDHAPTGKVLLVTGVRSQESSRRMGHVKPESVEGRRVWVAPIHAFSAADCNDYISRHQLPRNPVKDFLHMSGECLCGAFAKPGELAEIKLWYPETGARLEAIEARVRANGFPWGWEDRPPAWWLRLREKDPAQTDAFQEEHDVAVQQLCVGCNKRAESA